MPIVTKNLFRNLLFSLFFFCLHLHTEAVAYLGINLYFIESFLLSYIFKKNIQQDFWVEFYFQCSNFINIY